MVTKDTMNNKHLHLVECHICDAKIFIEFVNITLHRFFLYEAAAKLGWVTSMGQNGIFICCEECYPKAFDTSVGNVGRLKKEYHKYYIKE